MPPPSPPSPPPPSPPPGPPPAPPPHEAALVVTLVFPGVDFAALSAGGAGALRALADEIAAAWGALVGVPAGQGQVQLSAGSLVVDVTVSFVGEDADARVASTQASVTDLSLVTSVVRESPALGAAIGVESPEEISVDGMKALVNVSRNEKASNAEDAGGPSPGGSRVAVEWLQLDSADSGPRGHGRGGSALARRGSGSCSAPTVEASPTFARSSHGRASRPE